MATHVAGHHAYFATRLETMNPLKTLSQYSRSFWRRQAVKQEIDEEMQFHLAMRERDNLREGMPREAAAPDARRRFGNWQRIREDCRQACGASFGETVWQDLRFGLRALRHNPGYTWVAALTLALGVGVNALMFSLLKRCLYCRVAYPEPGRLVRVFDVDRAGRTELRQSGGDFLDEREQSTVLAHLCAFCSCSRVNLSCPGSPPDGVETRRVTADFFPTLGLEPVLGRAFTAEEEQPGRDDVVMLSQDFWKGRFGGDPQVIGGTLRLDGRKSTVIGVAAIADPVLFNGRVDVLQPLAFSPGQRQDRGNEWLTVIGRLKPGVPVAQAQAEFAAIGRRIAQAHADVHPRFNLRAAPLGQSLMNTDTRRMLWFLFALTGFVLLIACANLVNLQLARLAARSRELGIRAALGAGRLRLTRQLLTETLVLSLLGGALGLPLALAVNGWLGHQFAIGDVSSKGLDIPLDSGVMGFAFLISLLSGVLVGTAPAWLMVRRELNPVLKEAGRTVSAGVSGYRLQNSLIVAEITLAFMLLIGVGQMAVIGAQVLVRGPGWRPEGLTVGKLTLAGAAYDSDQKRRDFLQRLAERVAGLPGVERVSLSSGLPFERNSLWPLLLEGQAEITPDRRPMTRMHEVDRNYFRTLGMGLRQGREFTADEAAKGSPVVIVSQALAERLWLVLRNGLRLSLLGTLLGMAGGYALLVLLSSMQNGFDPRALTDILEVWAGALGAGVTLIAVALLACWLPARRATRIDPMAALRCE